MQTVKWCSHTSHSHWSASPGLRFATYHIIGVQAYLQADVLVQDHIRSVFTSSLKRCWIRNTGLHLIVHEWSHRFFSSSSLRGLLRSFTEVRGWEQKYALQRLTVCQDTHHSVTHTSRSYLKSPINQMCMFINCGRKPEYLEKSHTGMWTSKFHIERIQLCKLLHHLFTTYICWTA